MLRFRYARPGSSISWQFFGPEGDFSCTVRADPPFLLVSRCPPGIESRSTISTPRFHSCFSKVRLSCKKSPIQLPLFPPFPFFRFRFRLAGGPLRRTALSSFMTDLQAEVKTTHYSRRKPTIHRPGFMVLPSLYPVAGPA